MLRVFLIKKSNKHNNNNNNKKNKPTLHRGTQSMEEDNGTSNIDFAF